jgi:hypothetical protein
VARGVARGAAMIGPGGMARARENMKEKRRFTYESNFIYDKLGKLGEYCKKDWVF